MPVQVLGPTVEQRRVVDEIPAVHIVDVSISVVVNAVAGNFAWVGPEGTSQIRMVQIDARYR